jgi:hypothetical protein
MPIQSCGQSVSARRRKLYTETGLLRPDYSLIEQLYISTASGCGKYVQATIHNAPAVRLSCNGNERQRRTVIPKTQCPKPKTLNPKP